MTKINLFFFRFSPVFVKDQTFTNSSKVSIFGNNTKTCISLTISELYTRIYSIISDLAKHFHVMNHATIVDFKISVKSREGSLTKSAINNFGWDNGSIKKYFSAGTSNSYLCF